MNSKKKGFLINIIEKFSEFPRDKKRNSIKIPTSKKKKKHYTYFVQKASMLIRKLISGQGNAKQRLLDCECDIDFVLEIEIPMDYIFKIDKIKSILYKKEEIKSGEKIKVTSFRNTIRYMRKKTASKVILDIYDLYLDVQSFNRLN